VTLCVSLSQNYGLVLTSWDSDIREKKNPRQNDAAQI
jgi:hypothetical protein